jgi:phosphoglycolate phosphatase
MTSAGWVWPRAVIFDLDGTLVDSAPDIQGALNRLLIERGLSALDLKTVIGMIGDGTSKLVERGFAAAGAPLAPESLPAANDRFIAHYADHATDLTAPFPGVIDTLKRLIAEGCRIGVCTNKTQSLAEQIIDETGLAPYIEITVGGDTPVGRKPEPGSLLEVIARLDATPKTSLMVGDSRNDVMAARAAGVPVALVTFGYCHQEPRSLAPDLLLQRMDQLPARLAVLVREAV